MTDVNFETRDRVLTIELNRPAKKNALSIAMYDAMTEALTAANTDGAIRVVAFRGIPDCFCSGNDISDFMAAQQTGDLTAPGRFLRALVGFDKPLVAAVDGIAIGIGTTLLLHCDLVYVTDKARFRLPFVDLGLVPEAASSLLLPNLVGHQRAFELFTIAGEFTPARARELGIANDVVARDQLAPVVDDATAQLASRPPGALQAAKRLLKAPARAEIEATLEREFDVFGKQLASPEAAEAFAAFAQKRAPDFSRF